MKYIKDITENFESTNAIDTNDLSNRRIWKSVFTVMDRTYRLENWLYIYTFNNGDKIFARVNKEDANGVSGYGAAGVVTEFENIVWSYVETSFDENFIQEKEARNKQRIEEDKGRYEFLKSLPENLSEEEYQEIAINRVLDDI